MLYFTYNLLYGVLDQDFKKMTSRTLQRSEGRRLLNNILIFISGRR